MKVSASFLSSKDLVRDLRCLNETDVDYIHVDIMDGKFVKNKTMPFREMRNIYKYTSKRLDVHLMVDDPISYIPLYAELNTEFITIHVEIDTDIEECLKMIHSYSIKTGLAIKPNTKVNELIPYLPFVDMILIMSVEPGCGGQSFIPETKEKIAEVRDLLAVYQSKALISVDGGINNLTCSNCGKADILVAGSYIINSDNFQEKITSLR
ncbi:MAG: ribulose-phosphate 3-epimerase [bacterium]|nr:ribulose-phosphate 3-epimerase [bacterium]